MKIRKVYKTLGDPKYGYVEVTREGGRCISSILFNENDTICERLGYSCIDLTKVTEYWSTQPNAGPEAGHKAGQPDAGQEAAHELLLFARRGGDPWFCHGVVHGDNVLSHMSKVHGVLLNDTELYTLLTGTPIFHPHDGWDTWLLKSVKVSLPGRC